MYQGKKVEFKESRDRFAVGMVGRVSMWITGRLGPHTASVRGRAEIWGTDGI